MSFLTLGIETSCDETAAAVLAGDYEIRSSITASQFVHSQYGGVVPELASRAHIRLIVPVVRTALEVAGVKLSELNLIAATYAPGLLGALLVGLPFAKTLAWSRRIPFIGVNHLEGHIYAIFLQYPAIPLPFVALIVSGGHTELVTVERVEGGNDAASCPPSTRTRYQTLGATLDDACGEAFDKAAKLLGFPYPGGSFIEEYARKGARTIRFPLPHVPGLDFSFSGLKTALLYYLRDHQGAGNAGNAGNARDAFPASAAILQAQRSCMSCKRNDPALVADICHSFQETLIDFLLVKVAAAVDEANIRRVAVTGGVAVNARLREQLEVLGRQQGFDVFFPAPELCSDNAAMIAACGRARFQCFGPSPLSLAALAREAVPSP